MSRTSKKVKCVKRLRPLRLFLNVHLPNQNSKFQPVSQATPATQANTTVKRHSGRKQGLISSPSGKLRMHKAAHSLHWPNWTEMKNAPVTRGRFGKIRNC